MNLEAIVGKRPILYDLACARRFEYSVPEAESSLCPPRSEEGRGRGSSWQLVSVSKDEEF